jgi:hypothetical protein
MGGCDKTTPGLLMGAISIDLPAIFVPAGPMLRGNWHGEPLGSGSDAWKYWAELRAGTIGEREWQEVEEGIARSFGHCMTMGTASTMTSVAESLGLTLPGAASIPAADANHPRMAERSGRRVVEMVWEDLKPSKVLTREAFDNAITVIHALSGSTNAIIHLTAIAGRAGIELTLDRFDQIARTTPVLANIRPAGTKYLMEDFYYAGGLRALLAELGERLHRECTTVNGRTIGENVAGAKIYNDDVIRTRDKPVSPTGGLAVLRGNLAPNGAIIKPTAAEPHLLQHAGRAVVFSDYDDMAKRIDDVADSEKAVAQRRARHGTDFGCAHERHFVRHLRAACVSGVAHRRPARLRPGRRSHRARCIASQARAQGERCRAREAACGMERAAAAVHARLRRAVRAAHHPGRQRVRLRFFACGATYSRPRDSLVVSGGPGTGVRRERSFRSSLVFACLLRGLR